MKCEKAQNAILMYGEKRLKPRRAVALHRHVLKCGPCREQFLIFDEAMEIEESAQKTAPEGFGSAVMAKICALEAAILPELKEKALPLWLKMAGCVYALCLALGFAVLYNLEGFLLNFQNPAGATAQADAFFSGLGQNWAGFMDSTAGLVGGLGNYVLFIGILLGLALAFTVLKDKKDKSKA